MPKMKSNRSAMKRFRITKSGKFKRSNAFTRHLKSGKSAKRRRNLRKGGMISDSDMARVKLLLPHS